MKLNRGRRSSRRDLDAPPEYQPPSSFAFLCKARGTLSRLRSEYGDHLRDEIANERATFAHASDVGITVA